MSSYAENQLILYTIDDPIVNEFLWDNVLDNLLQDLLPELLHRDLLTMLCRDDDHLHVQRDHYATAFLYLTVTVDKY